MRSRALLLFAVVTSALLLPACRLEYREEGEDIEFKAIRDSLTGLVKNAYDFSNPDVVDRIIALYPEDDDRRIVSAAGGRVIASRDTIEAGIRSFWERVGRNMRDPRTEWGQFHVDVPSTRAAVVTAEYRVPHTTPSGAPHAIGGVMTLVFAKEAARWVVVQEHLSDLPQEVLNPPAADSTRR